MEIAKCIRQLKKKKDVKIEKKLIKILKDSSPNKKMTWELKVLEK